MCVCYLVDLIHHPEGAAVELLQGHEVEHGGDAALSATLMVWRQLVQLRVAVKLDPDTDPVLVVLLLRETKAEDDRDEVQTRQTSVKQNLPWIRKAKNKNKNISDQSNKRKKNHVNLVLCVQIHFSCTLHGAEEVTELVVDLFHQLLERVQPTLLSLEDTHTQR